MSLDLLWQDLAIWLGSVVGLLNKVVALLDSETVWNRASALTNAVLYLPSIAAFATLGLPLTAATATLSMLLWFGIGIFRTSDETDND